MLETIALWVITGVSLLYSARLHFKVRRLERVLYPAEARAEVPLPAKEVLHV